MKTGKRLDECYQKAQVFAIDDDSKYIMFSDIHRGDNSVSDEFAHNKNIYKHALQNYLSQGFTYIELGDGDELWEHASFEIIKSAHSDVFNLLRKFYHQNRLLMIYGNHNIYLKYNLWIRKNLYRLHDDFLEKKSELFPDIFVPESIVLKYRPTGQELMLIHGQQGDLFNDKLWFLAMFSVRFFWKFLHIVGFHNPASPSKNRIKRHKIEVNFSKWIRRKGVGIICGHTHRPKLNKTHETPYFNTGCCIHPRGINGIEIENGCISLVDWSIGPDAAGQLHINRKVIKGPRELADYVGMKKDLS